MLNYSNTIESTHWIKILSQGIVYVLYTDKILSDIRIDILIEFNPGSKEYEVLKQD